MRAVLTLAVVIAAMAAPVAGAQVTWSDPQTVSASGQNAGSPRVHVNRRGDAAATWHRTTENADLRVQGAFRAAPGHHFGLPEAVSAGRTDRFPHPGVDDLGGALAIWDGLENTTPATAGIRAAFRSFTGPFGEVQAVSQSNTDPLGGDAVSGQRLAIDPQGNAIAVWQDYSATTDTETWRLWTAFRPAGGRFESPKAITIGSAAGTMEPEPRIGIDDQGNATLLWRDFVGENQQVLKAAVRPAGGQFGPGEPVVTIPGSQVFEHDLAVAANGEAVAAFLRNDTPRWQVATALRPAGSTRWGPVRTVSDGEGMDEAPAAAIDSAGNAAVVWTRAVGSGQEAREYQVEAALRPAGGEFGAQQVISQPSTSVWPDHLNTLDVDMDERGNAVAAWSRDTGADRVVEAALAPAGGAFTAPVVRSGPGEEASRPHVDVGDGGHVVVVWEAFDGANTVIRASGGTTPPAPAAPGDPAPVPPPPPPPPDPTSIELAEPMRPNRPAVLTASVSGPVDRLEWTVPGSGVSRPVVGEVVAGGLQRSVRFRFEPGEEFRVTLRAIGPGGSRTFSRTFRAPRASRDDDVRRVLRAMDKSNTAPVFAVGDAGVLTGRSDSCAVATTLRGSPVDLSGCLQPIGALSDIPLGERGILAPLLRELDLEGASAELARTAVELTDGFITRTPLALDEVWPLVPGRGASILTYPQAAALTSSDAGFTVGGHRISRPGGFVLDLAKRGSGIDLGKVPRPPSLPSIGGFHLVGSFDVDLAGREAKIKAHLKLPGFLKKAGVDIQNEITFRATPDRLILDELVIGPMSVHIGALAVDDFRIRYTGAGNEWQGQGKACVIGGVCLDMVPPNGQVKVRNGRLDFAGASLHFPAPGIPLFSGVNLERIGFGFGLDPTRFTGNARLAFAHVLVIDGRMVIAFPTAQHPFTLRRDEVGNDFPARLYDYRYTGTTIGISAAAALRLPVVGEVPLAQAYVLYEYPGYLALGGGMSYAFREPITNVALISTEGRVDGEFSAQTGKFNVDGRVEGCVVEIVCKGMDGNVSSNGMAVCTNIDTFLHEFHVGGAIRWSPFKFIPYLDGCNWGRFREPQVRPARAAQMGRGPAARTVEFGEGDASRMVMLEGEAGAPLIRVTGPGGQLLDSPAGSKLVATQDTRIRIMRSESAKFVAVAFAGAAPGTYSIEVLPGSPVISSVKESTALPAAKASAKVSGRGARRVLSYRVTPRPDQRVSFFEVGAGGTGTQIGKATAATAGRVRFSPAPGHGVRRVEARFEIDGVPAETRVVARFRPPSPSLRAPRSLRVRRTRAAVRVGWRGVPGASRYEVAVTTADGRQRFAETRRRSATVRGVPVGRAGRVSVRAVDRTRASRPAARRFRAAGKANLRLDPLARCRVARRVVCRRR